MGQNRQDTTTVEREHREKNSKGYKGKSLAKAWNFQAEFGGAERRWTGKSGRRERESLCWCTVVDSFITCVFGIVLRSADYSRCTETRPRYFLRVSEFFSDSDKILAALSRAHRGSGSRARAGKTGQCGVRPRGGNILALSTFGIWTSFSLSFQLGYFVISNPQVSLSIPYPYFVLSLILQDWLIGLSQTPTWTSNSIR